MANNQRRQFLHLMGGLLLSVLPACREESMSIPARGDQFPEVALPDLDGRRTSFSAYSGAALIVNFWATWCEPCRREMPSLQRLSAFYRPEELRVVGVTVDSDLHLVREFQLRYDITFVQLSDRDQRLSKDSLHLAAFPTTYLLTRDRRIARIVTGERDWAGAEMRVEIAEALEV